MGINSGGINKNQTTVTELTVINGATIDSTTLVVDEVNDLVKIGDNLSLNTDSSVIKMGAGDDVTLTHDGTTGVTIAANPITVDSGGALNLFGTAINIGTDTDVPIDIDASTLDINASGLVTIDSNGGPISIGADNNDQAINIGTQGTRVITIGVDQDGLDTTSVKINATDVKIQNCLTTDGTFPKLTLQTGDQAIVANNILGQIDFQAPDDTGVDSDIVAASIVAIAEGTFSDSSNATSLQLRTGASEVATTKLTISSAGNATFTGDISVGGGDITYSNDQAATLGVTTSASGTVGRDLTISAGSTTAASGNTDGGDLILKSGFADGTGSSFIGFHTSTSGTDNAVAERMRIHTDGNVGIGDTAPGTLLQISGADPYLTLKNTTAENTDAGAESQILFEDHSDASLGNIRVHHSGSSDDTKAQMMLRVNDGSSLVSGIEITEGKVTTLNLAVGAVAQTQDHILFFDGAADGEPKVESIDDFLTAIAGSGISVSSSQLTASSGGASALNDLSDVSFGSGDLVISSLDLLTTSDSAHNAAGTGVVIRGGNTTAGTSNDQAGGSLTIQGGQGKGSGEGGAIIFQTAKDAGSSGNSLNSFTTRMTISQKGELLFGAAQDAEIGVESTAHDVVGRSIEILGGSPTAGTTNNIAGGDLVFIGGAGKGTGSSGEIKFQVIPPGGGSSSNLNTTKQTQMIISEDGIQVLDGLIGSSSSADVLTLDGSTITTTGTLLKVNAGALTTGSAAKFINNNNHDGVRDVVLIEQSNANSDNATALRVKQDGVMPAISMEFDGNATNKAPTLEFLRSSTASEANDMQLGQVDFVGSDSGNNLTTYAQIACVAEDVSNGAEDGQLEIKTQIAGTETTQIKIDSSGVHLPTGLAATAAASNADTNNGNVTSNNFKITHTLTLNGALADGNSITEFTVTSDKIKATSVVIASSNLLDMTAPREVVAGSFKISGKNKTGGTLADDSTVIINYLIL